MFRFFVNEKIENKFPLDQNILRHIKVARIKDKQFICIFEKEFYVCELNDTSAIIISKLDKNNDFEKEITIAPVYIDSKRFEWLIQKAAELGATRLIPVVSKNMSNKLPVDIDKKLSRWNAIALNASEQAFRNSPLIVEKPVEFDEIIKFNAKNKFIAHEKYNSPVNESLPQDSIFLVGPEGGFTDEEVLESKKNNFKVISLGRRILRAETASIFILSRVN